MRTLRGKYFISDINLNFTEINIEEPREGNFDKIEYYTMDRALLRSKVLKSGVFSEKEINKIESEGCKKVAGNSLCASPFSGHRYYLSLKFPVQIIKGLKILMDAVASDSADIVAPSNFPEVAEAFRVPVEKSPNIYLVRYKDEYPLYFERKLHKRLYSLSVEEDYFPGKEGVLIASVEKLYRIYQQVEEPYNAGLKYISVIYGKEKYFIRAGTEMKINDLLERLGIIEFNYIIKGDPLNGEAVCNPEDEAIKEIDCLYVVAENRISINRCIGCGRCLEVCPGKLYDTVSRLTHTSGKGLIPFNSVPGCIGCGLCGYFCPGYIK